MHSSHQILVDSGMGRSAYLCPKADCLQKARQKNHFQRSLNTKIPKQIYQLLQERLELSNLLMGET